MTRGLFAVAIGVAALMANCHATVPVARLNAVECKVSMIEFVHVGPEDASLPRLQIVVRPHAAGPTIIRVSSAGFADLCAAVTAAPAPTQRPLRFGTFDVSLGEHVTRTRAYRIAPETFMQLLKVARSTGAEPADFGDSARRVEAMVAGSLPADPARRSQR